MTSVYARTAAGSSVGGGRETDGAGHSQAQRAPFRANHTPVLGLQNGCRTGVERSAGNAISLEIAGGRTWIRTTDLFLIREAL